MSAITHEIIVKKAYKIVQQILEPHYNNSSETEGEYKFVTPEIEISLISNNLKEMKITVSFPNHEYTIGDGALRHTQLNPDKKRLAYFVQKQLCKIYDVLGKKYYESTSFTLHWTNVTTWISCIYPQFAFELSHNLPGKDFLENLTRQEDLVIYCLECAIRMVFVLRTSDIKLGLNEHFKKCQDISKPFKSWVQKSCKGNK